MSVGLVELFQYFFNGWPKFMLKRKTILSIIADSPTWYKVGLSACLKTDTSHAVSNSAISRRALQIRFILFCIQDSPTWVQVGLSCVSKTNT